MPGKTDTSDDHDDIMYPSTLPFILLHVSSIAAFWTGITWQAVAIGVTLYWLRMFAITAGYHRYFSHRAYSTSRLFQFILAFLAQSTVQKSVLWWAAKHRHHHLHSDTPDDVHSPRHKGFFYSHVGWIFYRQHDLTDLVKVADFSCVSGIAVAAPVRATAGGDPGRALFSDRGMVRPRGRFRLEHGAAVSRHLLHQFAGPCSRPQALRHRRRFPQQLVAGVLHHG